MLSEKLDGVLNRSMFAGMNKVAFNFTKLLLF